VKYVGPKDQDDGVIAGLVRRGSAMASHAPRRTPRALYTNHMRRTDHGWCIEGIDTDRRWEEETYRRCKRRSNAPETHAAQDQPPRLSSEELS
jgi:hypothetical protein